MNKTKLSPHGLGTALGLISAVGMLLMGLFALNGFYLNGWEAMMQWHVWSDLSAVGVVIGMIEAGVSGYVFGWLLGWLYNKFA